MKMCSYGQRSAHFRRCSLFVQTHSDFFLSIHPLFFHCKATWTTVNCPYHSALALWLILQVVSPQDDRLMMLPGLNIRSWLCARSFALMVSHRMMFWTTPGLLARISLYSETLTLHHPTLSAHQHSSEIHSGWPFQTEDTLCCYYSSSIVIISVTLAVQTYWIKL